MDARALELLKESPDKARAYLTRYAADAANGTTYRWKQLGEYLLVKYMDGNRKKEENGQFKTNGYGLSARPDFPGYDQAFYDRIVEETGDKFLIPENK